MKLKKKLDTVIFGTDTPAGKAFDVFLLFAIVFSVLVVILESVEHLYDEYGVFFRIIEWVITILFSLEYALRVWISKQKKDYVLSFYGIIDLVSFLPTYLSLVFVGSQYLLVIRALRLLRVFRILKLGRFVGEGDQLKKAILASRYKITVFMSTVVMIVIIMGTIMYLVEGKESGFDNIPKSAYWAIVTLTTVGYGDIYPQTLLGQMIASFVMVLGYAIIAVPTGIVTVELQKNRTQQETRVCKNCSSKEHGKDAIYCQFCSEKLPD